MPSGLQVDLAELAGRRDLGERLPVGVEHQHALGHVGVVDERRRRDGDQQSIARRRELDRAGRAGDLDLPRLRLLRPRARYEVHLRQEEAGEGTILLVDDLVEALLVQFLIRFADLVGREKGNATGVRVEGEVLDVGVVLENATRLAAGGRDDVERLVLVALSLGEERDALVVDPMDLAHGDVAGHERRRLVAVLHHPQLDPRGSAFLVERPARPAAQQRDLGAVGRRLDGGEVLVGRDLPRLERVGGSLRLGEHARRCEREGQRGQRDDGRGAGRFVGVLHGSSPRDRENAARFRGSFRPVSLREAVGSQQSAVSLRGS